MVVHESRTCDPDPGTPGDLDPSRMRQLLHRKGVAGYMIKQTDLHARLVRYKTDDQRTCMKGMLAIAHNGQVFA